MSNKKQEKKDVIDTHKVTPEAGEVAVDPSAKRARKETNALALDLDDSSPKKKGKKGPMQVGVNFDHTGN